MHIYFPLNVSFPLHSHYITIISPLYSHYLPILITTKSRLYSYDTVDGCEILHHQPDGWNMLKPYIYTCIYIYNMGCLPPCGTGAGFCNHPQYHHRFTILVGHIGGISSDHLRPIPRMHWLAVACAAAWRGCTKPVTRKRACTKQG